MTDPRVQALLTALRVGNTRRAAAAHAGIDHATFYRWLERNATFRDAVEKAEADAEVRFLAIIAQAAPNSWHAASWWLERRRHDDYGQRRQDPRRRGPGRVGNHSQAPRKARPLTAAGPISNALRPDAMARCWAQMVTRGP
jgi:hypothetical protein